MNQPTAIHHLSNAGYEWKLIIEMIGFARQLQRLGGWDGMELDNHVKTEMKERFDRANVDPMTIDFS
jgi:hypothetical protein